MKKFIAIPLILVLIFSLSCGAFASGTDGGDGITLETYFDIDTSELFIKGTADSTKGSVPMVLTLKYGGELAFAEQLVTGASDSGKVSFAFSGIPFSSTTPSGDYEIYVSAGYAGLETTMTYSYDGADRRFAAIKAVNSAVAEKDGAELIKAIYEYRGLITGGDETLFKLDADEGQDVFADLFIAKGSYELPADYEADENVKVITASVQKIAANYREVLVIAEAAELNSKTALTAWLDKYADSNGFYDDNPETNYDEAVLADYFKSAISYQSLYSRIKADAKASKDFAELKAGMLNSGILTMLEESKDYKIREITENEKLSALFTVDMDKFDKLSETKQSSVYQDLTKLTFKDIDDYIEKFDDTVKDTASGKSKDSGRGGASPGGSGGGLSTVQPKPQEITSNDAASVAGFTDLEDFEWAHDAIKYLSAEGVISGKAQGVFAPDAPTTRAEFTKMAVLSFGLSEAEYTGTFSDVNADDWFAPYVAAAYKAGIITGTDDGRFLPDEKITRQDMAVLLFRGKNMSPSPNERNVFTDSDDISDYAKSAVFTLYESGIVLGDGDGTFAPLRNATRAEAAQMIYKLLMSEQ